MNEEEIELQKKFFLAINKENFNEAKEYIKQGVELNKNKYGDYILFIMLFQLQSGEDENYKEIIFLLENGSNPNIYKKNSIEYKEVSFLHEVIRYYSADYRPMNTKYKYYLIIQTCLKVGANVNIETGKGDRPLDWAMQSGDDDLVDLLKSYGAVNSENYLRIKDKIITKKLSPNPFNDRIYLEEDVDKIIKFINKKYDLNAVYLGEDIGSTRTILEFCVYYQSYNDYYEVTEYLLQNGADPNFKASNNYPIHIALQSIEYNFYSTENAVVLEEDIDYPKPTKVIEKLIEYGANVNLTNDEGLTPLDLAVETQHVWAEDILLQYGAKHSDKYYSENKEYLENSHTSIKCKVIRSIELQNYYWNVLNKELLPKVLFDKQPIDILDLPKIHSAVLLNDFQLKQYGLASSETTEKIYNKIIAEVNELIKSGEDINAQDKLGCSILDYDKFIHRNLCVYNIIEALENLGANYS